MCQHLASYSGFIVKMQGNDINLYGVFWKTVCEEQHTQVVDSCDAQEAYNTVRELSSVILEKLVHCQSYKVMSF